MRRSRLQLRGLRQLLWAEQVSDTADRRFSLFRVLKEQWIRAKYERQEFMADGKTISLSGTVNFHHLSRSLLQRVLENKVPDS